MTPTDKYSERAREILIANFAGPCCLSTCSTCLALARAIEQAALEARIDEHNISWTAERRDWLRTRLAELEEKNGL